LGTKVSDISCTCVTTWMTLITSPTNSTTPISGKLIDRPVQNRVEK
jgi:hypothetical protein